MYDVFVHVDCRYIYVMAFFVLPFLEESKVTFGGVSVHLIEPENKRENKKRAKVEEAEMEENQAAKIVEEMSKAKEVASDSESSHVPGEADDASDSEANSESDSGEKDELESESSDTSDECEDETQDEEDESEDDAGKSEDEDNEEEENSDDEGSPSSFSTEDDSSDTAEDASEDEDEDSEDEDEKAKGLKVKEDKKNSKANKGSKDVKPTTLPQKEPAKGKATMETLDSKKDKAKDAGKEKKEGKEKKDGKEKKEAKEKDTEKEKKEVKEKDERNEKKEGKEKEKKEGKEKEKKEAKEKEKKEAKEKDERKENKEGKEKDERKENKEGKEKDERKQKKQGKEKDERKEKKEGKEKDERKEKKEGKEKDERNKEGKEKDERKEKKEGKEKDTEKENKEVKEKDERMEKAGKEKDERKEKKEGKEKDAEKEKKEGKEKDEDKERKEGKEKRDRNKKKRKRDREEDEESESSDRKLKEAEAKLAEETGEVINSSTHHTEYQRYKRWYKNPSRFPACLAERINSAQGRATLFTEYVKAKGDVEAIKLKYEQSLSEANQSQVKYAFKSEKWLVERYGEDNAKRIMAKKSNLGLVIPDPEEPEDNLYFCLTDIDLKNINELKRVTSLEAKGQVSSEMITAFTAAGGCLDPSTAKGDMATVPGMNKAIQFANLQLNAAGGRGKGVKKRKKGETDEAEANEEDGKQVKPELPEDKAKKVINKVLKDANLCRPAWWRVGTLHQTYRTTVQNIFMQQYYQYLHVNNAYVNTSNTIACNLHKYAGIVHDVLI